MPLPEFLARLEAYFAGVFHAPAKVERLRQLTGGASRITWSFDLHLQHNADVELLPLVLRQDMGGTIHDEALSREQEFRLLQVAHAAGVLVPRPRCFCSDLSIVGTAFFVMDRLEGESVGRRVIREPQLAEGRRKLPGQMGEQLAKIHALNPTHPDLSFLHAPEGPSPARAILRAAYRQLQRLGEPHPVLELTYRWLDRRAPACERLVVCHGDFRIGNLMVGLDGLRGVFDWEFAHFGDPAEDLAWPCVRSWRFGNDALRLGGVGQPDEMLDVYLQHTGFEREPLGRRLRYWEILGNFRWAVGCVQQANRHLSGEAPSLELASLGRRTAEMELELLDLIEGEMSHA